MALFLIRHGETPSNAARIVQVPETPLSERGIAQAGRLAARLARLGVAAILSSDLPRARMTAASIAAATGAPVALDADLQERNFGDVRGTPYDALGLDLFHPDFEPPGGETQPEFEQRVARVWPRVAALAAEARGNLAVVTHGLVCHAMALRHMRLPPGVLVPTRWHNTSLTIAGAEPPWQIDLLNCDEHCRDIGDGGGGARV